MSRCDLTVRIAGPEREYVPGDAVSGIVEVYVHRDCRCAGLTVSRLWKTHGRGSVNEGGAERQVVFSGPWTAGRHYTYPFTFLAPDGPFTYHGRDVNVDWYVHAQADLPRSLDSTALEDFVLRPDPAHTPSRRMAAGVVARGDLSSASPASMEGWGCSIAGCLLFTAPLLLLGGLVFVRTLAGHPPTDTMEALGPFIAFSLFWFAAVLLPAAGLGAIFGSRLLMQRAVGPLLLVASPKSVRRGDTVRWRAELTPRHSMMLDSISVSLVGSEVAVDRSGTTSTTWTHEIHSETMRCAGPGPLRPGAPLRFEGTFTVPREAVPSFDADDNHVVWAVRLRVRRDRLLSMDAKAKLEVGI